MFCIVCGQPLPIGSKFCGNCGTAITTGSLPSVAILAASQPDQSTAPITPTNATELLGVQSNRPSGIGGWLLLLIVSLLLIGPLVLLLGTVGTVHGQFIANPAVAASPTLRRFWLAMWTIAAPVCVSSMYAGWRLVRHRTHGSVRLAIGALWCNGLVANIATWVAAATLGLNSAAVDVGVFQGIVWSLLTAAIWTAYLKLSDRVRNTYVKANEQDCSLKEARKFGISEFLATACIASVCALAGYLLLNTGFDDAAWASRATTDSAATNAAASAPAQEPTQAPQTANTVTTPIVTNSAATDVNGAAAANLQIGLQAFQRGNYAAAVVALKPLAEQGDAIAQYNLGLMYGRGLGVTQDYAEANSWIRKSAIQGNAAAQYILGSSYHLGLGVPRNYVQAVNWLRKAVAQGNASAQVELGTMYSEGSGVPQNYAEAIEWFRKAAAQGDASAQYDLGNAYSKGMGVPQDSVAAYALFNLSVSVDPSSAYPATSRDEIAAGMTSEQIADAQALTRQMQQVGVLKALDAR